MTPGWDKIGQANEAPPPHTHTCPACGSRGLRAHGEACHAPAAHGADVLVGLLHHCYYCRLHDGQVVDQIRSRKPQPRLPHDPPRVPSR